MAKIRIDRDLPITNGLTLTFQAPADCSQITGLVVYYQEGNTTKSQDFKLVDAHGVDVGSGTINLFATNALVKVVLNTDQGKAYVQNADTNAYLEGKLAEKYSPNNKPSPADIGASATGHKHTKSEITDFSHTHSKSEITDFPSSMTPTSHASTHKTGGSDALTPADIGASATGHKHTKSEITDFPSSMPPTAHTHSKSEITDFPSSMPPTAHTHNKSEITGLNTENWTFTIENDDGSTSTVTKAVYVG